VALARLLERGLFDTLFIADVLGVYDVYQGSRDAALRHAVTRGVRPIAHSGRGPIFVGSPAHVADELERWMADADLDGFNLASAVVPETFEAVVGLLVPELQRRGRYPTRHAPGTLREKLFGRAARLPTNHAARRVRIG
jgi:alkanesulfonate monooxygenase SsuD/methylene tetrahydromethanopterin reductase-like flavin-dependent oxidoreductase (luciferase family)